MSEPTVLPPVLTTLIRQLSSAAERKHEFDSEELQSIEKTLLKSSSSHYKEQEQNDSTSSFPPLPPSLLSLYSRDFSSMISEEIEALEAIYMDKCRRVNVEEVKMIIENVNKIQREMEKEKDNVQLEEKQNTVNSDEDEEGIEEDDDADDSSTLSSLSTHFSSCLPPSIHIPLSTISNICEISIAADIDAIMSFLPSTQKDKNKQKDKRNDRDNDSLPIVSVTLQLAFPHHYPHHPLLFRLLFPTHFPPLSLSSLLAKLVHKQQEIWGNPVDDARNAENHRDVHAFALCLETVAYVSDVQNYEAIRWEKEREEERKENEKDQSTNGVYNPKHKKGELAEWMKQPPKPSAHSAISVSSSTSPPSSSSSSSPQDYSSTPSAFSHANDVIFNSKDKYTKTQQEEFGIPSMIRQLSELLNDENNNILPQIDIPSADTLMNTITQINSQSPLFQYHRDIRHSPHSINGDLQLLDICSSYLKLRFRRYLSTLPATHRQVEIAYHGTSPSLVSSIMLSGLLQAGEMDITGTLKVPVLNGSRFGNGVYVSPHIHLACHYGGKSRVFICLVAMGNSNQLNGTYHNDQKHQNHNGIFHSSISPCKEQWILKDSDAVLPIYLLFSTDDIIKGEQGYPPSLRPTIHSMNPTPYSTIISDVAQHGTIIMDESLSTEMVLKKGIASVKELNDIVMWKKKEKRERGRERGKEEEKGVKGKKERKNGDEKKEIPTASQKTTFHQHFTSEIDNILTKNSLSPINVTIVIPPPSLIFSLFPSSRDPHTNWDLLHVLHPLHLMKFQHYVSSLPVGERRAEIGYHATKPKCVSSIVLNGVKVPHSEENNSRVIPPNAIHDIFSPISYQKVKNRRVLNAKGIFMSSYPLWGMMYGGVGCTFVCLVARGRVRRGEFPMDENMEEINQFYDNNLHNNKSNSVNNKTKSLSRPLAASDSSSSPYHSVEDDQQREWRIFHSDAILPIYLLVDSKMKGANYEHDIPIPSPSSSPSLSSPPSIPPVSPLASSPSSYRALIPLNGDVSAFHPSANGTSGAPPLQFPLNDNSNLRTIDYGEDNEIDITEGLRGGLQVARMMKQRMGSGNTQQRDQKQQDDDAHDREEKKKEGSEPAASLLSLYPLHVYHHNHRTVSVNPIPSNELKRMNQLCEDKLNEWGMTKVEMGK